MSVNCTWKIDQMTHKSADGGVITVYWSCVAASVPAAEDDKIFTATDGGQIVMTYDASAPGFIPYGSLTEIDVLGWVYADLAANSDVENETPEQAKARVENERVAKVWAQIERANQEASGLPWDS